MPQRSATPAPPVGWFAARPKPGAGLRPTVRFAIAFALTAAWVGFSVWVSEPWRNELSDAIGPVMAWVIPVFLAYIPGLVIGFMAATLIITRYREPAQMAQWPPVTVVVAAYNEEDAIVPTLEAIAALTYPGAVEVVLAGSVWPKDQTGCVPFGAASATLIRDPDR